MVSIVTPHLQGLDGGNPLKMVKCRFPDWSRGFVFPPSQRPANTRRLAVINASAAQPRPFPQIMPGSKRA
ncbi:hypothetical protein Baya_12468 [Bagarius yarrelli]|uniref:Uncharacterized protein n=1 Tax=Bagarius yarrelli TaxID=175774 RepID=A0A556V394_BAGYA|nr:hypothetical protein Baya_12468 [Bagarius yarrelli]